MMISASDVLHIISEIHQYSMLLMEFKDATTLGILHSADDRMNYFKLTAKLTQTDRSRLVEAIYSGKIPEGVHPLTVEEFLREIEDKKMRHIWLETGRMDRREHGFMSISELKAFFRAHPTK
jgi:hypothetical protein